MGQGPSKKEYSLPSGKKYVFSYCRHYSLNMDSENFESINLENLLETSEEVLEQVFNYKLKNIGYSFKTSIKTIKGPLHNILNSVILPKDISFLAKCYQVQKHIIQYFLTKGDILVCGLIMDEDFLLEILGIPFRDTLSDIILIVGYTPDKFLIKTNWTPDTLEIPWIFVENIQELWNINIESPEEKYLELM